MSSLHLQLIPMGALLYRNLGRARQVVWADIEFHFDKNMSNMRPNVSQSLNLGLLDVKMKSKSSSALLQKKEPVGRRDSQGYFDAQKNEEINGFTFIRTLGQGTYGRVYLVQKNAKQFACKVSRFHSTYQERCKHELQLMLRLQKLEVVPRIEAHFMEGDFLFVVMELCVQNLTEFLNGYPHGLPYTQLKELARHLLAGLADIHSCGIVHGDIKPSNIMFASAGNLAALRIVDFGCSGSPQQLCEYIQSRPYRAPEVMLRVGPYTEKLDVWSAGCVLFEARRGCRLFEALTSESLCADIVGLLGVPPLDFVQKAAIRYFVINPQYSYFYQNKVALAELGIEQSGSVFPGQILLQQRADRRNLKVELLNYQLAEDDGLNDKIFHLIAQMIRWTPQDRASCGQLAEQLHE